MNYKTLFMRKSKFFNITPKCGGTYSASLFFNSPYVTSPEQKNPDWYIGEDHDPFRNAQSL